MSNHKITELAIKKLEIQVGQLAKQIAENSSGDFGANTEKNPKEECKVVMTRSKRETIVENESRTNEENECMYKSRLCLSERENLKSLKLSLP